MKQPAFPLTRARRYEGQGGWAKDSYKIPLGEAALYVFGTGAVVWATWAIACWIAGN